MRTSPLARHIGIRGEFDIDIAKMNSSGIELSRRRVITGGKNLITNTGMDRVGSDALDNFGKCLQVGTSSSAPANTDTALAARVAGVAGSEYSWSWDASAPKVGVMTRTYTFGTGAATGVLAELGLSTTTTGTLSTRALFEDGGGNPITVTVLADEQLIVTYRLLFAVTESDSVLVTTQKGTEYTLTLRPANLGASFTAGAGNTGANPRLNAILNWNGGSTTVLTSYRGGTSAIGSVTGAPTGTAGGSANSPYSNVTLTYGTYTSGNYYRDDKIGIPLTEQNFADVGAFMLGGTPFYTQIGVSPRITKTSSDIMSFTVRTAWARG